MRRLFGGLLIASTIKFSLLGAQKHEGVERDDTTSYVLKEVIVSDNGEKQKLKSAGPLQQLSSENILKTGVSDISDAMKRFAGVNLRDYGGLGGMKTVSVRGLGAQHTGVIYDGAPLNDMLTGQIDLSRYSLHNLSNIKLSIGDGNNIFNFARISSAAANISITSLNSPELLSNLPQLSARIKISSFLTYNPYLKFSKSNGKSLAYAVNADYLYSLNNYPFTIFNGIQTSREKRSNAKITNGHIEGNLIWKTNNINSFRLKGYYYQNHQQLPGPVIYYAEPSNERLDERNAFGQFDYLGNLSSLFSLKAIARYSWSSTRYKDKNGKYQSGLLDNYYIQNEEYVAASGLLNLLQNLKISLASDFFHNYLASNGRNNDGVARNTFLESLSAQYNVWRLNINANLLYSGVVDLNINKDKKFSSRLSPSLSLSVFPLEHTTWSLRASYKNIYRMPTFNELYFDHYGTVNLDPEITDQFNLGSTYLFSPSSLPVNMTASIDAYINYIKNKIVAVPFNMFIWTMSNIGKVRSTGIDFTLTSEVVLSEKHNLLLSANYSYQRAATRTNKEFPDWNKQLPYTPLNSGAASITWENPWVNIVLHGSGCSSRFSSTTNVADTRMPGYMEFGLSLYREIKIKSYGFEFKADVLNLFDKQYEIVRRYPMPGRSFSISIGFKLN